MVLRRVRRVLRTLQEILGRGRPPGAAVRPRPLQRLVELLGQSRLELKLGVLPVSTRVSAMAPPESCFRVELLVATGMELKSRGAGGNTDERSHSLHR